MLTPAHRFVAVSADRLGSQPRQQIRLCSGPACSLRCAHVPGLLSGPVGQVARAVSERATCALGAYLNQYLTPWW